MAALELRNAAGFAQVLGLKAYTTPATLKNTTHYFFLSFRSGGLFLLHSSLWSANVISLPVQITIIQSGPKAMQGPVQVRSVVRGNPPLREKVIRRRRSGDNLCTALGKIIRGCKKASWG